MKTEINGEEIIIEIFGTLGDTLKKSRINKEDQKEQEEKDERNSKG